MKLVTLKNQENKQTSIDHISGFTITSAITGLLVTESNEVKSGENWPQTGIHTDEWFDEYMKKHCRVSVSQTDLGDCIRVNSSDADVFGIRGFVVTVGVVYNKNMHMFESGCRVGNDVAEEAIYTELEVVIPHHNFFGSEGMDSVHNVIRGLGFNYLARGARIAEMSANDVREQRALEAQEPAIEDSDSIDKIIDDELKAFMTEVFDYSQYYQGADHFLINSGSASAELTILEILKLQPRRFVSKKVKRAYQHIADIADIDAKMPTIGFIQKNVSTIFMVNITNENDPLDQFDFNIIPTSQHASAISGFIVSCKDFNEKLKIASKGTGLIIRTTLQFVDDEGKLQAVPHTFGKEQKETVKTYSRFSAMLPTRIGKITVLADIDNNASRTSINTVMDLLGFKPNHNRIDYETNYESSIRNYFTATIDLGSGDVAFMVTVPEFMSSFDKGQARSMYREFVDDIHARVFSYASKTKTRAMVSSVYEDASGKHYDTKKYCPETDAVEGTMNCIGHGVPAFAQEIANGIADSKLTQFVPGFIETKYTLHPQCPEVNEVLVSESSKRLLELINHKYMCVKDAHGDKGDAGATFFAQPTAAKFDFKGAKHWVSAIKVPELPALNNLQFDLAEKGDATKTHLLIEVLIEGKMQKIVILKPSNPKHFKQPLTDDDRIQHLTAWAEHITQFLREAIFIATVSVIHNGNLIVSMATGVKK